MRQESDSPTPHIIIMATMPTINKSKIPNYVSHVTNVLEKAGFEAFLVGGCVRDLIIGSIPKDWDITTNATPDEIISLFEKTVYENTFGTVAVCIPKGNVSHEINENVPRETSKTEEISVSRETKYDIVEVTPYRTESKYSDFRHPDEVKFSKNIEDDLKRRDFTINALALDSKGHIKDMFDGLKDIKDKVLRTVGSPIDRFQEDALRMLRAVRFSTTLEFAVSYETMQAIADNANLIENVSFERIRDEFTKIIMSKKPSIGIILLHKLNILKYIIPELEQGIGCIQGGAHKYDVWEHLLQALDHAADKNWSLEIRLSALFHDIGKPISRRDTRAKEGGREENLEWSGTAPAPLVRGPSKLSSRPSSNNKKQFTFYGHEVVGARLTKKIMERLKYPKDTTEKVISFTRNHMFFSDTEKITLSAVRRIIQNVGKENIWDLMKVRECDRVGMAKAEAPYRLRKYHAMIEEALHDPISVSQLAIDGNYLLKELSVKPGPRMGWILHALLEEVLDDPSKNNVKHLSELVKSLEILDDKELRILGEKGKERKEKLEEEEIVKLHKKHGV